MSEYLTGYRVYSRQESPAGNIWNQSRYYRVQVREYYVGIGADRAYLRVTKDYGHCYRGDTDRSAYAKAIADATAFADAHNATVRLNDAPQAPRCLCCNGTGAAQGHQSTTQYCWDCRGTGLMSRTAP